jgi:hypothetical protein
MFRVEHSNHTRPCLPGFGRNPIESITNLARLQSKGSRRFRDPQESVPRGTLISNPSVVFPRLRVPDREHHPQENREVFRMEHCALVLPGKDRTALTGDDLLKSLSTFRAKALLSIANPNLVVH